VSHESGDQTVYLVLDRFGRNGCVWRETDAVHADLETVIADLMAGQYNDPNRVIAFNTAEHWSQDVSEDVALEIERRADLAAEDVSSTLDGLMEHIRRHDHQLILRLASS
jgi:hypothetical protein